MGKTNSIKAVIYSYVRPVKSVAVEGDTLRMVLGGEPRKVQAFAGMVQQIANAQTDQDIMRCLRAYGTPNVPGKTAVESIFEWKMRQEEVRCNWPRGGENQAVIVGDPPDGLKMFSNPKTGALGIYTKTLHHLAYLFALAQPKSLKICINPECKTPYIISSDGKVKLCKTCRKAWNNARHQATHRAKMAKYREY